MAEPYRAEQGTIVPKLFVGLGGVGSRIVNRIAQRAMRLPNWSAQLKPLTSFVAIDTNQLDLDKLQQIPQGHRIHIGGFDKAQVIQNFRDDRNHQALQWLPSNYQPRPGIKPGAGQIRLESRLGYFYNSPTIRARLAQIVHDTLESGIVWRRNFPADYYVYMFCTLGGGTGSGSFLPMAYLVRDVVKSHGTWEPRVIGSLLLSTMTTARVDTALHIDIHANSYAALKELEYLTRLNYKQVQNEGRQSEPFVYHYDPSRRVDDVMTVKSSPFFLGIIYDRSNLALHDVGGVDAAVAAVADTAFLQLFTPLIDNMAGALDNYEKKLVELARFSGELKDVGQGYSKNFGAVGAAALVLPGADLLEYSALRFAAEALRSQITFGLSSSDSDDDRARALARLAINYDDPKFLRMSDERRDEEINRVFMESVRELARQDERQELPDGFWATLVQTVDTGRPIGTNDAGETQVGESLVEGIKRKLEEDRRPLISLVSIRERAFAFHREGVSQYSEMTGRLRDEIRAARVIVEEGLTGLRTSAREGEVISALGLDPISERYVVLRVLERCTTEWIPATQKQFEAARVNDITNPKVQERLDEYYKLLQDAGNARRFGGMMRDDETFLRMRDEAEEYYRRVAKAARTVFETEVALAQVRCLKEYLEQRSRQYARLARQVNGLADDLDMSAENLRRGGAGATPRLALSVEVFETLEEPRRRLWSEVFRALYVDGGRSLSTFDRSALASVISQQLKPEVRADGTTAEKTEERLLSDLRHALVTLGRTRLRGGIEALDVARGLEFEAALVLNGTVRRGETPSRPAIDEYVGRKVQALDQLAGIMARSSASEWAARGDGVVVDRTRYILHGPGTQQWFLDRLESGLGRSGRTLNKYEWHDGWTVVVYDVELPIPLYYIRPVIEELEPAYLKVQSDEARGYNLHIDMNWEESLPNLNPRRAEISVGWALRTMARALTAGVVSRDERGVWRWQIDETRVRVMGPRLSGALYDLGELHRREDMKELRLGLEEQTRTKPSREQNLQKAAELKSMLRDIALRRLDGAMTPQDSLDRPILEALVTLLEGEASA
jgi:hypothetical protein